MLHTAVWTPRTAPNGVHATERGGFFIFQSAAQLSIMASPRWNNRRVLTQTVVSRTAVVSSAGRFIRAGKMPQQEDSTNKQTSTDVHVEYILLFICMLDFSLSASCN